MPGAAGGTEVAIISSSSYNRVTVLLRYHNGLLGARCRIAARVVLGYIGGVFDPELGRFAVRERDAHAWTEIYSRNTAGSSLSPTAGRPPIVRVSGELLTGTPPLRPRCRRPAL
jgi:hypothetical protein